jgi:DNA-3-methyladenine glycosylase II
VRHHETTVEVRGPWSLATSKAFWEGFTPKVLSADDDSVDRLRSVFRVDHDWSRAEVEVTQRDAAARVVVTATATSTQPPPRWPGFCPSTSTPAAGPRWAGGTP